MNENYEYIGPLCVAVAGLVYGLCDFWINGGRTRRLDLFDGMLDQFKEERMLVLERELMESVEITCNGVKTVVTVVEVRSQGRVRLGFEAPKHVKILRTEVADRQHEPELGGEG